MSEGDPTSSVAPPSRALDLVLRVALVSVDLAAKMAVPAALLLMTAGHADGALAAAVAVNALAVVRGMVAGRAVERAIVDLYRRLVRTAGQLEVAQLRARPDDQQVTLLIDAADRTALVSAMVWPRLFADAAALVLLAVVVTWRLGTDWLLLGATVAALGAGVLLLVQRALGRTEKEIWARFGDVARDVEVLLDAAAELRAHDRQDAFSHTLLGEAAELARHRRRSTTLSALVGLLPVGVVLLAAAAPLRDALAASLRLESVATAADVGVLGATALAVSFSLARGIEELLRSAPKRRSLARLLAADTTTTPRPADARAPSLLDSDIVFDAVAIRYPGAAAQTPGPVTFRWQPGQGLALGGDNGAGKTSLVLALLGLLEPSAGTIRIDGGELAELDWAALRRRVVYLPQHPFVAPRASVRWHLQLLAHGSVDDAQMSSALRSVDLHDALQRRGDGDPLDVSVGSLSGGERRRLQLARAFLPADRAATGDDGSATAPAELIILDEPEAGLDRSGRLRLREVIGELAEARRVLLIAHDPSVIPDDFARLSCERIAG